jgi:hypothetical protein
MLARFDRTCLAALTVGVLASCGTLQSDEAVGAVEAPAERTECLVDGEPLSSYPPSPGVRFSRPPTETLASALRLYATERFEEAAVRFAEELAPGPRPDAPEHWFHARLYLAKSHRYLGHEAEARALFLQIARTEDDPYRWSAAGWLCGEHRPTLSIGWTVRERRDRAETERSMIAAWRAAWDAVDACGEGRAGYVQVDLAVSVDGSVADATLVAAGWYDVDYAASDDDASPYDAPTSDCVLRTLGAVRFPPTVESAHMTFALR